jgi:hypothetical protein
MTQDRSINISGNFEGVVSTGDYSVVNQSIAKVNDVANELQSIMQELEATHFLISSLERREILRLEISNRMRNDPTFRDRFINALKSGGVELVKVFTNNPFVSVPIETVKGWIEAEHDF